MRYRTEKYQKDITKQLNFQTQTLKQDLLREIRKMLKLEPDVEKHHYNQVKSVNVSKPDTKRLVACHSCDKDAGENTKHFYCLDCDKFFGNANMLNRHIQTTHTDKIMTICNVKECCNSKKEM